MRNYPKPIKAIMGSYVRPIAEAEQEYAEACAYIEAKCSFRVPRDPKYTIDIIAWASELRACERCQSRIGESPQQLLDQCRTHGYYPTLRLDDNYAYGLYAQYTPCGVWRSMREQLHSADSADTGLSRRRKK